MPGSHSPGMDAWDWHQPRIDVWKAWFDEYGKLQKNVTINITQVPYAEYLKKLQAGIPAGQAPDMFYFHNNFHTQLVDTELVDPLPEDRFPRNVLNANFQGMKEGYFHDAKTRQPRYMVTGVMSGGIYYNKELWQKAGLKESDLPKTWDDVAAKAKALTQYDNAGRINVAGFAFNGAIGSLQMFTQVYVMTKGGPVDATRTIVYLLYDQAFSNFQFGYASSVAFILFAIILTLTLLQLKFFQTRWEY